MAPGCFAAPSAKESSAPKPVNQSESAQETQLMAECLTNNSSEPIISKENQTNNYDMSSFECYAAQINLDQIPLPLSPPPPLSPSDDQDDEDDDDDASDDGEDDSDDDDEDDDGSVKKEVDTFEILEQTIIKQKRLAKLKNTDLRRKVLLKRTFDLVLEIMDAENGFNDDEPVSTSPISPSEPAVELQLHPETIRMDDSDDEEEEEPMVTTTTLVKLVDVASPEIEQESSARVPRQIKRRCSSDDDDDDNDDDNDADDENEPDQESELDETYFYEYSMNHLNDQQLNYKTSVHSASPLDHPSDLKIYADSLVDVHKHRSKTDESSSRSNHARKRMRSSLNL